MNALKVEQAIKDIMLDIRTKGLSMNKPSKKKWNEMVALVPSVEAVLAEKGYRLDTKCDAIVSQIIKDAQQAGGKTTTKSAWNVGGDADVWTETSKPSALWLALNEQPEPEPTPDQPHTLDKAVESEFSAEVDMPAEVEAKQFDTPALIERWRAQPAPAVDDLDFRDVVIAKFADNYLREYRVRHAHVPKAAPSPEEFVSWGARSDSDITQGLRDLKRGFAILNGYKLVRGTKIDHMIEPSEPDGAAIIKMMPTGTVSGIQTHAYFGLVPVGTLISMSEAAELLYGENNQANRMKVQRLIESETLTEYIDYSERNPQHRRRLSRAEVEALRGE